MIEVGTVVMPQEPFEGKEVAGMLGLVVKMTEDNRMCLVQFKNDIDGHSGNNAGLSGHCWWLPKDKLTELDLPEKEVMPGLLAGRYYFVKEAARNSHCVHQYIIVVGQDNAIPRVLLTYPCHNCKREYRALDGRVYAQPPSSVWSTFMLLTKGTGVNLTSAWDYIQPVLRRSERQ